MHVAAQQFAKALQVGGILGFGKQSAQFPVFGQQPLVQLGELAGGQFGEQLFFLGGEVAQQFGADAGNLGGNLGHRQAVAGGAGVFGQAQGEMVFAREVEQAGVTAHEGVQGSEDVKTDYRKPPGWRQSTAGNLWQYVYWLCGSLVRERRNGRF